MKSQRNITKSLEPRTIRPQLEVLEHRLCMTCRALLGPPDLLFITDVGSPTNNVVEITDDGAGNIDVRCDGGPVQSFTGVGRILVRTGNGDDSVSYRLVDHLTTPRDINIDLGKGNDLADLQSPYPGPDWYQRIERELNVYVNGGSGNDTFRVDMRADEYHEDSEIEFNGGAGSDTSDLYFGGIQVVDSSRLRVAVTERSFDRGNDRIDAMFDELFVELNSVFDLDLSGGFGDDDLSATVGITSGTPGDSMGEVDIDVLGNGGNDTIGLQVVGRLSYLTNLDALSDGGRGHDDIEMTVFDILLPPPPGNRILDGGPDVDVWLTGGNVPITVLNCP